MTCAKCKYSACVSICENQYQCVNGHTGLHKGTEECPDGEQKSPEIIGKEDWYE